MCDLKKEELKKRIYEEIEREEKSAKINWRYAHCDEVGYASNYEDSAIEAENRADLLRSYIDKIDNGEPICNCVDCVFYNPNYTDELGVTYNLCEKRKVAWYDIDFILYCPHHQRKEN